MTVALYLMTQKGLAVLVAALASGVEVAYVVTAPARGMDDDAHERISAICKADGIPVFLHAAPPLYVADLAIAAGWRRLLDVPQLIVLHDSLLPRYRGFSPLITALVNGESEVGVTAFLAAPEPDTGPIIAQRAIPVSYPARVGEVITRLLPLYAELAGEVCSTVKSGLPIRAAEQDHARATYSAWRDDDDFRIDWARDDRRVCRLVDAASAPFAGAWTTVEGRKVRVLEANVVPDVRVEDRSPGKILRLRDGVPTVVCGTGLVELVHVADDANGETVRFDRLKVRCA